MTYTSRRYWSVCITTVMQLTKEMMASAPKMYMLFWIVPANIFKKPWCSFWPFASIFFPCRIQLILRFRNNKILYRILYKILLISPPPNQVYQCHPVSLILCHSVWEVKWPNPSTLTTFQDTHSILVGISRIQKGPQHLLVHDTAVHTTQKTWSEPQVSSLTLC